jgi:dynein heavy chain
MKLEELILLGAMGPPGGGRSQITGRAVRHFNVIAYTELEEDTITRIFTAIVTSFFRKFNEGVRSILPPIIDSVIRVYNRVRDELLPTPSKSHYTFNLRDISKVFQGVCGIQ